MSKQEPLIQKYMTTNPFSITGDQSIHEARVIMRENAIRHLPVVENGKVIGLLSDRDMKLAGSFIGSDLKTMRVQDIDIDDPFKVSPDATLHDVVKEMADNHYGSAVVIQHEKLVGIFTTVDACRALAEVIKMRHHKV